jgi:hypothetical protein
VRSTPLSFEELHKITLCNLALGTFYWRMFLIRAVGAALCFFVFSAFQSTQLKTKKQCAAKCVGLQKL